MKAKQVMAFLAALVLTTGSAPLMASASDAAAETPAATDTVFAGGSGTEEDPWQVSDADQLKAVNDHLDGNFILTADIDLKGEEIEPIGAMIPVGSEGEDAETPTPEKAFTGVFDGDDHTISNYKITGEKDEFGIGLFGCLTGDTATVKDLNVENASVTGEASLVGAVIGYQDAAISGIHLSGTNTVSGTGLVGGVSGGAMDDISDCSATADVSMTAADAQGAGVLVGGLENGSLEDCSVTGGSVTATQSGVFSVGGLSGCFQNSEYAKNCNVSDVTVTVGENAAMVGALSGHAGRDGGNKTEISNCSATNVTITAGQGTERVGGISGSGFYMSKYKEAYAEPCAMAIKDCTVTDLAIEDAPAAAGLLLGYAYTDSTVENSQGTGSIDGKETDLQIGADADSLPLEKLK